MKSLFRRPILKTFLVVGIICLLGGVGMTYYSLFTSHLHLSEDIRLYVDRDDTVDSVYHQLKTRAGARRLWILRTLASCTNWEDRLRTGSYRVKASDSYFQLFKRLYRGEQWPVKLTIPETRTWERFARSIGNQLMIDSTEVMHSLMNQKYREKYGLTKESLYGFFLPQTYEVYWNMSLDAFWERMNKEHQRFWNEARLQAATHMGLTKDEVCTLASIVDEETNEREEKPIVAGLYMNRLQKGIPLQADPTVRFAVGDFSLRRILGEHLVIDSPYNTYRHVGLPPGPIRIPSLNGIEAVLNFAKHDYLYMCAKEDFSGTHSFASTYAEHLENARRYRQALNQLKIFR